MLSLCLAVTFVLSASAQDHNPMILIPGISGSELVHKQTLQKFWFKVLRSRSEDLRLPIAADPTRMHDNLIPGDVLRDIRIAKIIPVTDVYGGFLKAMQERGGYHEEKWDRPSENGDRDALYVFAYDWRLDNVENARLLIKRIAELKRSLNRPDLKFDIVAHSMGGIIARYAVMYGDAELPRSANPQPTWAGAKLFDKVILLGTPNEGSVLALSTLQNGFTLNGVKIDMPFVQDASKFTAFTIPAAYQLLPAPGTLRAYNDKLEPIAIDIYDPRVWTKYGWSVIDDKKFGEKFSAKERKVAATYFAAVLDRAKRLHEALAAGDGKSSDVTFYQVGADCKQTLDSIIVFQDQKDNEWKTLTKPKGFVRSDGHKVSDDDVKKVMLLPGDGIVSRRSMDAETQSERLGVPSLFAKANENYFCEEHNKLAANTQVQDYIINVLTGKNPGVKLKTIAAVRPLGYDNN
jgi:pimeloyl-ACP methyl ester carboxylesterase